MHNHIHSQPNPLSEQLAAVTAQRDELFELLEKFFDEYERGTPAYEYPDNFDGYLGNAFALSEEMFGRICEVLNSIRKTKHLNNGTKSETT